MDPFTINYDLPWNPVRMIQRAGRVDRLFSPHDKIFIYNVMPEQSLEELLKLVQDLSRKIETIEEAVALDASVLGEKIEARELDKIMQLRAGGHQADRTYLEGERNQGIEEGQGILNRYLDLMKAFATEEIQSIPNGIYSVKQGSQSSVYVMLKMPEHLSGEDFWRFYPNANVAQSISSPNDVLRLIEAQSEELRLDLPTDENPFKHLQKPLEAAVSQVGEAYMQAVPPSHRQFHS